MALMLELQQLKTYFTAILRRVSCCDLCGESINKSPSLMNPMTQQLLCEYCMSDLPYFDQTVVAGNLLNWPAIHRALPNIQFDQIFALVPYINPFDHWLSQLKYFGRFELAELFSALLSVQWQAMVKHTKVAPVDLVLSVPLHVKKWKVRGYNQAHLIAKPFAKQLALPYDAQLLIRVKHNDSQMGKTGSQRRKNLANAFSLSQPLASNIKHVLLIDDVVTTGTTASEISKLLKQAGVETVTLVTVCLTLPKVNQSNMPS
jgi:ComF family protein